MELFQRILSAPPLAWQQSARCTPQGPAPPPPLPTLARDSLEFLRACLPLGAFDRADFGSNKDLCFRSDVFIEILCTRSCVFLYLASPKGNILQSYHTVSQSGHWKGRTHWSAPISPLYLDMCLALYSFFICVGLGITTTVRYGAIPTPQVLLLFITTTTPLLSSAPTNTNLFTISKILPFQKCSKREKSKM